MDFSLFSLMYFFTLHLALCFMDLIPRLILHHEPADRLQFSGNLNQTVLFHSEGCSDVYVGGKNTIYRINMDHSRFIENVSLTTTGEENCKETSCDSIITVIQHFQDHLVVCGTNGHKPLCWNLHPEVENGSSGISESYEGTGISPYVVSQNSLSLTVDGDLYAVAPLHSDGSFLQFRRKAGRRRNLWMYDRWVTEPTFISATSIKRKEDPENEKIYIFFREKNSDSNPEADPWISRVARVCKVDEGGPKRFFQNTWTSFLKARLACGIPDEALYFNRLQDVFVQEADDWRESKVYALFTSSWNSSAICIYSLADIDGIFENSIFKGFNEDIPSPRPGTCVMDSINTPLKTMSVVRDHAEMTDWIHPIQKQVPFYVSSYSYTKITVDRVMGTDLHLYNVLFLATEYGIHKILEHEFKPFIISETLFPKSDGYILSMILDSKRRKLLVGFADELVLLDTHRCQDYNQSCEDCVLARDPYCAWSQSGCTATAQAGVQDAATAKTDICPRLGESKRPKLKRSTEVSFRDSSAATYAVPLDLPFYLSCPVHSHHASYTWKHNSESHSCQPTQSNCLHLIPAMTEDSYGTYECVSNERDYAHVLKTYQLVPSIEEDYRALRAGGHVDLHVSPVRTVLPLTITMYHILHCPATLMSLNI